MTRIRKIVSLILTSVLLLSMFSIGASAASYPFPILSSDKSTPIIPEGETGKLFITVFHEYNYEKLQVRIYDEDGYTVGSSESQLNNKYGPYITNVTISINTSELELGIGHYTVEYWMDFYSLYQWNSSPNSYSYSFDIVANVCKGNHKYEKSKVITEPTCEEDGEALYKCSKCKFQKVETVSGAHNYTSVVTLPTYTENGYTTFTCTVCGDSYTENYIFPDVRQGTWYYDAVEYVAREGFMSGYKNGKFGPADNLQRQDFVVALARIAGADLTAYENSTGDLKDVVKGAYYAPAVAWAVDQGIITGYQNGKFGVGDTITREQVATIFYRYVGSPEVENIDSTLSTFPDQRRISSFSRTAMAWAVQNNVVSGMQNGTLSPTTGASRAQIATIIMRMDQSGLF